MASSEYNTKVYEEQGGDRFVIASGGTLLVEAGGTLTLPSGDAQGSTVFTGDVTVSASNLVFSGTTGQNNITLTDNLASALKIEEASNAYLTFVTTNSGEGITVGQHLTMADAKNVILNATTGTKIGTATTQKLAFYNSTPVVQPAGTANVTGFVAGSGTASKSDSVWAGAAGSAAYTVGDIVTALKALGLLAS